MVDPVLGFVCCLALRSAVRRLGVERYPKLWGRAESGEIPLDRHAPLTYISELARKEKRMKRNSWGSYPTVLAMVLAVSAYMPVLAAQNNTIGGQSNSNTQSDLSQVAIKLEKMSTALQLTPAQKEQIRPILMEEAPKLKALKSDTSMPPLQKMRQMRQIADDTDAKLKPILSPQQYEKWQQMRAQEREQMMQKMENR